MLVQTTDVRSNVNDQLVNVARAIGRSARKLAVFREVYRGKRKIKTVAEIAQKTKLSEKDVLTVGAQLVAHHAFYQTKADGRVAYEKDGFLSSNKAKIIRYAQSPRTREAVQTKSNPGGGKGSVLRTIRLVERSKPWFKARLITVDDVDSFLRVRKMKAAGDLPKSISEETFKKGVQKIIGESGQFKDWGGEKNDLFTTRARIDGIRLSVAFQFKGPGKSGTLVPGKLGKNGDQIQRLFSTSAQAFFVQYWTRISESVIEQMQAFALVKSISTRQKIYYGVIDGADSYRLYRAYPSCFQVKKRKR